MPVVRQILKQDMGHSIFMYLALIWTRTFSVFGAEYNRLLAMGDHGMARLIMPELKVLLRALREKAAFSPTADAMITGLKSEFPSLRSELGTF